MDKGLFSTRYGFGEASEFSFFIHQFLVDMLEATKLSEDETEYRTDFKSVQIGTYKEGHNGLSKRYHVPESVAECFCRLSGTLRKTATSFREQQEAVGKNLLLQMLKSDPKRNIHLPIQPFVTVPNAYIKQRGICMRGKGMAKISKLLTRKRYWGVNELDQLFLNFGR